MSTDLADALRQIAAHVDAHDLPPVNLQLQETGLGWTAFLTATDRRTVSAWAISLQTPITRRLVGAPHAATPFVAYKTTGDLPDVHLSCLYSDLAEADRIARCGCNWRSPCEDCDGLDVDEVAALRAHLDAPVPA